MRRFIGLGLIGLGAFLLVTAVLVRFYAYPQLAVAPTDQNSVTELSASGATIFDSNPEVLEEITTDLSVKSRTVGDVKATEDADDGVLVWVNTTSVRSEDGTVRSRSIEKAAHDANTGEAVNCCGEFTESEEGEPVEVKRTGLVYKFPFSTEKKTYKFWDGDLNKATDAKYDGEDEIEGTKVYKFVQDIPKTSVGTREIPASVLGLDEEGNVEADSMYQNVRTMWVEPITGAVVDRTEEQVSTYEYEGESLTATEANLQFTDKQVTKGIDDIKTKAKLLGLAKGVIPIGAAILGLLALAAGFLLSRGTKSTKGGTRAQKSPPAATS